MKLEFIFYTQLASLIVFICSLFILYRILVSQKDATIELLKEQIKDIHFKLSEARNASPDILAEKLSSRVSLLERELNRLSDDKERNQTLINEKETELKIARKEAEELNKKILNARDILQEFSCPKCGALLVERSYQTESREHYDIDHEHIYYECGYEISDGEVVGTCRDQKQDIRGHNTSGYPGGYPGT
jgi:predicted RNA-binding Zn-ribbon protein involved in translation (DUF1610 family)